MTMAAAPFHSAAEETLPAVGKGLTRKGTRLWCSQRDRDAAFTFLQGRLLKSVS